MGHDVLGRDVQPVRERVIGHMGPMLTPDIVCVSAQQQSKLSAMGILNGLGDHRVREGHNPAAMPKLAFGIFTRPAGCLDDPIE